MAIYATSDWHGYMSIYKQIKDFINLDDTVYVLGDSGDRGPHGWECIKACLEDPQIKYLKGNHDDMTAKAMYGDHHSEELSYYNGGYDTFQTWIKEGMDMKWARKLQNLPTIGEYKNKKEQDIYLCHAGFTIGTDVNDHQIVWDRKHIFDKPVDTNKIVIHGHTPVRSIIEVPIKDWYKPYWYANFTKCDIDMGIYRSGKACLLNLDTWDYKIFDAKE